MKKAYAEGKRRGVGRNGASSAVHAPNALVSACVHAVAHAPRACKQSRFVTRAYACNRGCVCVARMHATAVACVSRVCKQPRLRVCR
eukprot:648326-Pleurochrysis_carterae.AAC.1